MSKLEAAAEAILLNHLTDGLKAIIDEMIARGVSKEKVLACIKDSILRQRGSGQSGQLTVLAAKSYLESK